MLENQSLHPLNIGQSDTFGNLIRTVDRDFFTHLGRFSLRGARKVIRLSFLVILLLGFKVRRLRGLHRAGFRMGSGVSESFPPGRASNYRLFRNVKLQFILIRNLVGSF